MRCKGGEAALDEMRDCAAMRCKGGEAALDEMRDCVAMRCKDGFAAGQGLFALFFVLLLPNEQGCAIMEEVR